MTGKLFSMEALLVLVYIGYLVPMYVGSTQGEKDSLPGAYYKLLHEALLSRLKTGDFATHDPGAMLAAAVLFTQKHPDNSAYRQQQWLERALALGDLFAQHSEEDANPNKQDYEWDIHFWLDTYRLLRDQLGQAREQRWHRELEKISTWFAEHSAARADFPRYQGPYIRTSTNHLAIFASITYLAGKVLDKPEWVQLGARVLRRLALEEQTPDGYWGEFTDNGPATGYNYFTLTCVALYYEHSGDKDVLCALERAKDFHIHFTWPDGTPVETINGRNRYWPVNSWGHFAFSHWPEGRRYAAFLTRFFQPTNVSSRDLGRLAQN
ncbi:MAG: hypothetical protein RMJ19_10480, partial [Gemmatales bacterium]|nr:hypothetical protein [Gemmatales bacterium]MDW8176087.1 hypothetical protein [Gemmatales bacterium]